METGVCNAIQSVYTDNMGCIMKGIPSVECHDMRCQADAAPGAAQSSNKAQPNADANLLHALL